MSISSGDVYDFSNVSSVVSSLLSKECSVSLLISWVFSSLVDISYTDLVSSLIVLNSGVVTLFVVCIISTSCAGISSTSVSSVDVSDSVDVPSVPSLPYQ